MNLFEAVLLGIVQGATEFLPVSSSGHLILVPSLLKMDEPDLTVLSIAHMGTLLAILIYFWGDLWAILAAVFDGLRRRRPLATENSRLGWYIFVGTIPAGVAGLLLEDSFDRILGKPLVAAFALWITAGLLVTGERLLRGDKTLAQMRWKDAIIIGLAQMLALTPGISRSGSTITGGLARGLDRATAARYSFLLGIPAFAGTGVLALLDLRQATDLSGQAGPLAATFLSAAVVGYVCIAFLLNWLRERSLYLFAGYCLVFSLFYLLVAFIRQV